MTRFVIIGSVAGVIATMTIGWFITGYLCHRFQKATPLTWRTEGWHQHVFALCLSAIGGGALGVLDARVFWGHQSFLGALAFAALVWSAVAAPVLGTMAVYVNLHRVVIAGLLIEWLLFTIGVSLACLNWAT